MERKFNHKASPVFYQGNKIIRISDLPQDQSHLFSGWLKPDALLQLNESPDKDCVSYEDYEYWFQNYFIAEKDLNYLI
ncbi:MAG: hypothetical protein ACFHWX_20810 [Bacteroidota bacterium]